MLRRILVVDMDESRRGELASDLYGYFIVSEAQDVGSAKRVLTAAHGQLSAVVIQIGGDALEAMPVLERVKAASLLAQPPVVIVAKERDEEAEMTLLSCGASDYIVSGVRAEILRQRISNLINLREISAISNDFSRARQSMERLQAIMDGVHCGIMAVQLEGTAAKILFSNNFFYEMLGYTKETYDRAFPKGFGPILKEDAERVMHACRTATAGRRSENITFRAVRTDGEVIWLRQSVTCTRLMGVQGSVLLCVFYDITSEQRAYESSVSKTAFLSRMSHDMRTPMNAILGLVTLARDENNPPATVEYLDDIATASQYLLDLINDVLDLSKIESGKIDLHEAPYPGEEFARYINTMIVPLLAAKKQHFECRAECGMANIIVDRVRFNQIFMNLLSNAVKYTPEGGHISLAAVGIPDKHGKHGMRFIVSDDGIGMQPEFLKYAFEPYTQENQSKTLQRGSSGLGLAIVKRIVEAMDGSISVSSVPGKGSTFTVDLYAYEATPATFERQEKIESFATLEGLRVLLVEDNDMNIMVTRRLLERKGCSVAVARDGLEAVERFSTSEEGHFGVILMDLRMPVMDGCEAAERIRKMERLDAQTVPIIAMTADAFSEDLVRTAESGMNAHLTKPVVPDLLYNTIAALAEG